MVPSTTDAAGVCCEPLLRRPSCCSGGAARRVRTRARRRPVVVEARQWLPCKSSTKEEVLRKEEVADGVPPALRPTLDDAAGSGGSHDNSAEGWRQLVEALGSPYDEQIMALAVPAMLTLAADPLLSIVDTFFVGRLGPDELGALGVNTALYSLAFLLFNFLANTTTPLVASAVSAEDRERAGQVTIQGLLIACVLGTSLFGGLVFGQDWLLDVMGAHGSLLGPAKEYLVARSFAAPAVLLVLVGTGVLRGLQDMKTPLLITLFANAINFVLDPILIYGLNMGVRGAAVATTAAECLSAAAYIAVLWGERETLGLDCSFRVAMKRAQADYLPFAQAGGTMLLRTFVLLFTKTLASSVSTHLGSVNIAAHQVVAQFWLLHSFLTDSLAVSAQSLVAVSLGQGDRRSARGLSDRLLQFGFVSGVLGTVLLQAAYPVLPSVFTDDQAVAAAVYSIAPIATFVLPISSAAYVFDGIFIGAEDFGFLAFAMASSGVCVCTGLFLVEPLGWGLPGVWWCQSGMMVLRSSFLSWRYQQQGGPIPPQLPSTVPLQLQVISQEVVGAVDEDDANSVDSR